MEKILLSDISKNKTREQEIASERHFRSRSEFNTFLNEIYFEYLDRLVPCIRRMQGTVDDTKDVFHDALILIYKKINQGEFKFRGDFFPYLKKVCCYIWLRRFRKEKKYLYHNSVRDWEVSSPCDLEVENKECSDVIRDNVGKLSDENAMVIHLYVKGDTMQEIAQKMGYTESFVRIKKYRAKNQLKKKLEQDHRFVELSWSSNWDYTQLRVV